MATAAAIPAPNYTPEQLAKERRYLERIGNLMRTDHRTLSNYAKIKLWEDGPNYQKVVKYVKNSQCHTNVRLTVVNIHRVWRRGDPADFFQIPNRMLLWHGTKRNNIPRILDTGFVLPRSAGQMFGSGIYFADRITKSSNYSDSDKTFLLLCEVSLGKQYSCKKPHNTWTSAPEGFDSVKANGTYVPDWTDFDYYMGSKIPSGKTALCTKYPTHAVKYNEFIVYDPSRIIIRFLVEVSVQQLYPPVPMTLVTPRDTSKEESGSRGRQRSRSASASRTQVPRVFNNNGMTSTRKTVPRRKSAGPRTTPTATASASTVPFSATTSVPQPPRTLNLSSATPEQLSQIYNHFRIPRNYNPPTATTLVAPPPPTYSSPSTTTSVPQLSRNYNTFRTASTAQPSATSAATTQQVPRVKIQKPIAAQSSQKPLPVPVYPSSSMNNSSSSSTWSNQANYSPPPRCALSHRPSQIPLTSQSAHAWRRRQDSSCARCCGCTVL